MATQSCVCDSTRHLGIHGDTNPYKSKFARHIIYVESMSNLCRINVECMSKTTCDTTCGAFHVSICWASYEYLQNCNVGIVLALHQPTLPARKDATAVPLAHSALYTNGPRTRLGCTLTIGPLHMRKVLRFRCTLSVRSWVQMHPRHRTSAHAEGPPVRMHDHWKLTLKLRCGFGLITSGGRP